MQSSKNKIYITGVSGFIGSRVAKLCFENGFNVIGITRSSPNTISKELNIDVIQFDLNDTKDLKLDTADTIIHCATPNEINSKDVEHGLSLSIVGTNKIFEAARIAKISNIIYLSTAQVYGTELSGYYDETTLLNCESSYAINHYLGEELCRFYCNNQNFNTVILRPTNVYGIPQVSTVRRKTLVPMCFVDEVLNKGSLTMRSSGKQKRNFIFIDDLAIGIIDILKNFPNGFSLRNCGSNHNYSMLEIANIVIKSYEKIFNKQPVFKIQSDQPKISNEFNYKSISDFNKKNNSYGDSQMKNVINELLKSWRNN